ncbi:ATP-binding cassette domain-containing protein [Streptomyces diastatochromogenes]|nr:ATP-binding cassette domain-containing protein [Streptomyces diastatochromogenes]
MVGYGTRLLRTGLCFDDWVEFIEEAGGRRLNQGTAAPPRPVSPGPRRWRTSTPTRTGPPWTRSPWRSAAAKSWPWSARTAPARRPSKLLSGLYLPTEGRVRRDGHDTTELDPHALWAQTAVVPQPFAQWPLTARENITLGQPHRGDGHLRRAAEQSGAHEVVDGLRSGLDTLLAREWFGGVQLSGGQWQRIAIARAFHRSAGLLVMDEETSASTPAPSTASSAEWGVTREDALRAAVRSDARRQRHGSRPSAASVGREGLLRRRVGLVAGADEPVLVGEDRVRHVVVLGKGVAVAPLARGGVQDVESAAGIAGDESEDGEFSVPGRTR